MIVLRFCTYSSHFSLLLTLSSPPPLLSLIHSLTLSLSHSLSLTPYFLLSILPTSHSHTLSSSPPPSHLHSISLSLSLTHSLLLSSNPLSLTGARITEGTPSQRHSNIRTRLRLICHCRAAAQIKSTGRPGRPLS